jgi:hypothetical protein
MIDDQVDDIERHGGTVDEGERRSRDGGGRGRGRKTWFEVEVATRGAVLSPISERLEGSVPSGRGEAVVEAYICSMLAKSKERTPSRSVKLVRISGRHKRSVMSVRTAADDFDVLIQRRKGGGLGGRSGTSARGGKSVEEGGRRTLGSVDSIVDLDRALLVQTAIAREVKENKPHQLKREEQRTASTRFSSLA